MAYKYGKTFKKNGKLVRYRYTDGKKDDSDSCSEDVRTSTARSESGDVDRKTEQPTGTILNRHLRWKGEEDWNPCACILVTRFVGRSNIVLDRWRYGANYYRLRTVAR